MLRQILAGELSHTLRIGVPGFVSADGLSCGWTADSTPDEMHVEVENFDAQLIARVAAKVRPLLGKGSQGGAAPAHPVSHDGSITVAGLSVKTVQQQLNRAGAHLVVDGILGPLTTQAIRVFQAHHGLVIDGIVGPKTEAALDRLGVVRHPAPFPLPGHEVFGIWNYPGVDAATGKTWESETRSGDPRFDRQSIRNFIKTVQGKLGVAQDGIYWPTRFRRRAPLSFTCPAGTFTSPPAQPWRWPREPLPLHRQRRGGTPRHRLGRLQHRRPRADHRGFASQPRGLRAVRQPECPNPPDVASRAAERPQAEG